MPLNIFEPRYLSMIDASLAGNRIIGMIQPDDQAPPCSNGSSLCRVGCAGRITSFAETGDNRYVPWFNAPPGVPKPLAPSIMNAKAQPMIMSCATRLSLMPLKRPSKQHRRRQTLRRLLRRQGRHRRT